jgi:hypothetical protein
VEDKNEKAEFMKRYNAELKSLIDECIFGKEGVQALMLLHTPAQRTVAMYAVNADEDDVRMMLLSAATPYIDMENPKVIN